MKNFFIIISIFAYVSCADKESFQVIFPEKVFVEFNWCSYEENKDAEDLGKIFIDYKNFLDPNNFYASYLNPTFQVQTYDFILMESFKNKEVFHSNLQDREGFFYKRWKTNFEQTAKCDELKKQYFYEHTNSSLEAINKKDIEFKFSFCKKLDNVSIDQFIDNLEILKLNNIKNIFLLTPEILNDYYDYLFIISSIKEEEIEENILSNNIGFLINCNLNFNDGDLNQLLFESYPLI